MAEAGAAAPPEHPLTPRIDARMKKSARHGSATWCCMEYSSTVGALGKVALAISVSFTNSRHRLASKERKREQLLSPSITVATRAEIPSLARST
jgi:hypothetical protein